MNQREKPGSACVTLPAGELFAERYRIERVLGEGGSSVVYAASVVAGTPTGRGRASLEPGQRVALKVLHPHLDQDHQLSRRFYREARLLGRIRGQHLAAVLDFGASSAGQLYMAQEFVAGHSLADIARKPIDPERVIAYGVQICNALTVVHTAGIVHRDLKPLNIMVEVVAERERIRVLDFGMAKIVRADLRESFNVLTQQNMVFGTPEYMAPEQARGEEIDARADIYSAGVILYELLTGTLPFRSSSPVGVMAAHIMEPPQRLSQRVPAARIPPALEAVVLHALAKEPAQRYPTAEALGAALLSARERPHDLASARPPPPGTLELGIQDTDLDLGRAANTDHEVSGSRLGPSFDPTPQLQVAGPSRIWIAVALIAAGLGVAVGLLMSMVGALSR